MKEQAQQLLPEKNNRCALFHPAKGMALVTLGLVVTGGLLWMAPLVAVADPFAEVHPLKLPLLVLHLLLAWGMLLLLGAMLPLHVFPQLQRQVWHGGLWLFGVLLVASLSGVLLSAKLPELFDEAVLWLHRASCVALPLILCMHLFRRAAKNNSDDPPEKG